MRTGAVRVTITRFVDEAFPGWVECRLTDVHGREWTFIEKVPIVSLEELDASSSYPRPADICCSIVSRRQRADGREIVTIDTWTPDGVESTDEVTQFEVFPEQLITIE